MNYPDAVDIIGQLIDDEAVIIITTLIEIRIKSNRKNYLALADHIFDITRKEMLLAAKIRRKARADDTRRKSLKAPDAIVAASALVHGAVLVSNNDKDFNWICRNFNYNGQTLAYFNPILDNKSFGEFNHLYLKGRTLD
ncbi:PIN domain-containing protein [Bacillus salacetis]|uniref:PIN domain-containing protein n=2 Tax=Bacillus salacetis TaxID=2315464 RepID=A0A3A1QUJ4_9BACI|nr:PIN domain-containing protein [Bacillus salacetis]